MIKHNESVKVRLLKVKLPDGELEVLLTTLLDKKFKPRHFAKLYQLRWGVEMAIFNLESFSQLVVVSSYKPRGIEQAIWAQYAMYNLQSMLIRARRKQVRQRSRKRKFPARINRNVSLGLIKRQLDAILNNALRRWQAKLLVLLEEMMRHLEPKRSRPSRQRDRKVMRQAGRHAYKSNYQPTL